MATATLYQRRLDRFRLGKAYTVSVAARLAHTTPATVRRWLTGYSAPGHRMEPVFGKKGRRGERLAVSLLELAEIVVVGHFRKGLDGHKPVPLERLRVAHEYARKQLDSDFPFASMKLKEFGGHILHVFDDENPGSVAMALDLNGQWVLPGTVQEALDQFDFKDQMASRWFPAGRNAPIVIDPRIGAGYPVITGTGVTIEAIVGRARAGETRASIARDFEIRVAQVTAALQFAAA